MHRMKGSTNEHLRDAAWYGRLRDLRLKLALAVAALALIAGALIWMKNTLQQVLPGAQISAFAGTRPPVPDKVAEPLVVLVDHATGELVTRSLWR